MRPRLRMGFGGLRGRLLLALVLTSAVTLAAAAAVVLGPLQQRLRDQSTESLRAAVLAARPRFEDGMGQRSKVDREIALSSEAFELSDQTAGRVLVTDLALTPASDSESPPGFLADSESGPPPRQAYFAAVRRAQPPGDRARRARRRPRDRASRSTATAASPARSSRAGG